MREVILNVWWTWSLFVLGCAPGLWKVQAGTGYSLNAQRVRAPA